MYSKLVSGCGGFFLKVNKQPEIYPSHYRTEGNEFTREMKPKHQKWDLDPQNRKQRDRVCCWDRHLFQQWQQGHQPSERDLWRTARKTKHATASPKPVGKKAVSIQNRTTISPSKSHWFFHLEKSHDPTGEAVMFVVAFPLVMVGNTWFSPGHILSLFVVWLNEIFQYCWL